MSQLFSVGFEFMFKAFHSKFNKLVKLNNKSISKMIFTGDLDRYQGFHVKFNHDRDDLKLVSTEEFETSLTEALKEWTEKKYRVSWFQLDLQFAQFVPILAKFGYVFHHSKTQYVVMNKWLSPNEPKNIPGYAFTNVGVGGLVVDKNDRILVVKEKHFFGKEQMWKFPGGYAEQGEDFGDTAVREVLEETGIKCQFQSVIAFRHFHKFAFGCSDLYIVCHLAPIESNSDDNQSSDGLQVKKCSFEIDECKWFPIDEIRPQLSQFNLHVLDKFLFNRQNRVKIGLEAVPSIVKGLNHLTYSIHKTQDL